MWIQYCTAINRRNSAAPRDAQNGQRARELDTAALATVYQETDARDVCAPRDPSGGCLGSNDAPFPKRRQSGVVECEHFSQHGVGVFAEHRRRHIVRDRSVREPNGVGDQGNRP